MDQVDIIQEFRDAGAWMEGHFILSSGLRSPVFLQKARVFMDPARTERLCKAMAARVREEVREPFDAIISPAVGGIIPGYEMARQLGLPAMFTERENGEVQLRRGFTLKKDQPVLLVEDIVTTGLSSRECLDAIRRAGGRPVAAACLIDRSGGTASIGVPLIAMATLEIPTYAPADLPEKLKKIPPIKPGSRELF
jgi:orotate phosphoribosyltransferase